LPLPIQNQPPINNAGQPTPRLEDGRQTATGIDQATFLRCVIPAQESNQRSQVPPNIGHQRINGYGKWPKSKSAVPRG